MAFYTIEPFGPERADMNAGIIAATIANCHRDPKLSNPAEPKDFMPQYDKAPPVEATPEDLKRQLIATFGGKIRRKEAAH